MMRNIMLFLVFLLCYIDELDGSNKESNYKGINGQSLANFSSIDSHLDCTLITIIRGDEVDQGDTRALHS